MVNAYFNHGRWVADCPQCNSAERVDPGQPEFLCGDGSRGCGYHAKLQFPADLDMIVAVLKVRPVINQNWNPYETVADLRIENAAHQLPSGLE